jgi:hypothetical protein
MKKQLFTSMLVLGSMAIFAQPGETRICRDIQSPEGITEVNAPAPDFTATFTDGTTFNLYTYLASAPNHYVFLDMFFVDWQYCPGEVPNANTLYTDYGCNKFDVFVIGPNDGDSKSKVEGYMTKYKVKYPMTFSTTANNNICKTYNPGNGYPELVLISPNKTFVSVYGKSVAQIKALMVGAVAHSCTATDVNDFTELSNAINIYPSLTNGNFTIAIDNSVNKNFNLEIVNVLGQSVYTENIDKETHSKSYDFSGYQKGVYFIKLNDTEGTGTVTKKLILE